MTPLPYKDLRDIFRYYWSAYGGWRCLFSSAYLHAAVVICFLSFSIWTKPGWWDIPLTILPNLFGFSLGGYAVWLSFGDGDFRRLLCRGSSNEPSVYMQVNASFAHFIIIQIFTLLYALVAKSQLLFHLIYLSNHRLDPSKLPIWSYSQTRSVILAFWFIGFLLFIYSILCGLAATMAVFRFSKWLDIYTRENSPRKLNHPRFKIQKRGLQKQKPRSK